MSVQPFHRDEKPFRSRWKSIQSKSARSAPNAAAEKIKPKTDETDENWTNNEISQTQNENKVSGRGHKRRRSGNEPLKHLALNGADAEKGNKV